MSSGRVRRDQATDTLRGPLTVPAAKVQAPQASEAEILRTSALERVLASDPRVLVVAAPAGFGKTTFVDQWSRRGDRRRAWASLDSTDSDPVVLISTLLAALSASGATVPELEGVLTGDEPAFSRRVLPGFRRVVEGVEDPISLVIDDLHLVEDFRLKALLTGLVDSLAQDSRVALVSRTEPDLPLARWRGAGAVEIIDQEDLAFDESDVAAMLGGVTGQQPERTTVLACLERTGGWPVASYLEASFGPRAGNAPVTAGSIGAYLDSEVLAGVPGELAEFLRDTSILTLLDGPSCDAVLNARGSHELLLRIARHTLLVAPLNGVNVTYRLHPLIREHLVAQLEALDPVRASELHARAAEWFDRSEFPDEAIRHALATGDPELVGRLVWTAAQPALIFGRIERVLAWTRPLEEKVLLQSPELCMTATWTAVARGEPAQAARWAAATADTLGPDWPTRLQRSTVEPGLALLLAIQGVGGYEVAAGTARAAGTALPIHNILRPLCRLTEGWCSALAGDVHGGSVAMTDALSHAEATDIGTTWVEAAALLAFVQAAAGRWVAADLHIGIARQAWLDHDLEGLATSTMIMTSVSAWLHARGGRLDAARLDLERASARLDGVARTLRWAGPLGWALRARTLTLLDEFGAAAQAVNRALASQDGSPGSPLLDDFIADTKRDLEQRTPLGLLTPAERRVWDLLRQGFSRQEMAEALFVSDDTIKTHVSAIYRKTKLKNRRDAMRLAAELASGSL